MRLSERGIAQARAIAEALEFEAFDRIYSSGLSRAIETARIVAEPRGAQILIDDRLQEFDFGRWEGLTWNEIVAAEPYLAGMGSTAAKRYAPDGGESFSQVRARVDSFLDELSRQSVDAAAIVTHAGPLHAMFSALHLGESENSADHLSLNFTPGGITRIALESGTASVLALNDLRHLDRVANTLESRELRAE